MMMMVMVMVMRTRRKTTRFLDMLLWMMLLFSRQLNWMRLLFLPTRGTMILTLKRVRSWYKLMYKLTSLSKRRKAKGKGKSKGKARANIPFVHRTCPWRTADDDSKN